MLPLGDSRKLVFSRSFSLLAPCVTAALLLYLYIFLMLKLAVCPQRLYRLYRINLLFFCVALAIENRGRRLITLVLPRPSILVFRVDSNYQCSWNIRSCNKIRVIITLWWSCVCRRTFSGIILSKAELPRKWHSDVAIAYHFIYVKYNKRLKSN